MNSVTGYQNAMVSYNSGGLSCGMSGGNSIGSCGDYWYPNYWDTHNHYYTTYIPTYTPPEKSKLEQAFKIMQKLMEKKIVKTQSLKTFIEMVNSIAEIL